MRLGQCPSFTNSKSAYLLILLFALHSIIAAQPSNNVGLVGGKSISEMWQLDEAHKNSTFRITTYRPIFFVFGNYSSDINKNPKSFGLENAPENPIDYNNAETLFQLSLKTKVFEGLFWNKADLWVAYTQKANYQLYTKSLSRPMRELNYEPEVILNLPVDISFIGFRARMFGIGFNHESNGLDLPVSRSWNRIIFHAGFERGPWQLFIRPWIRLQSMEDNNPKITDFIGRTKISLIRDFGSHRLKLIGRHSLNLANNRGSIRFDWTFPIKGNFNGYFRVFSGYGESLIDYNHKQSTIGLGISFVD